MGTVWYWRGELGGKYLFETISSSSSPTQGGEPHVAVLKQWYPWASEEFIEQVLEDLAMYGKDPETWEQAVRKIAQEITEIVIKKQKDYGPDNILGFGRRVSLSGYGIR